MLSLSAREQQTYFTPFFKLSLVAGIFLSFTNDSETLIVQDLLKTSPFWNEYRVGLVFSFFVHVFCCDCIDSEAVSIRNRIRITLIPKLH